MIRALFALVFLPCFAFAQVEDSMVSTSSASSGSLSSERYEEFFEVEAQVHTVSIAPSMTFGPAMIYQKSDENHFGFRALAPFSRSEDVSVLSFTGFWRHMFTQKKTALFSEAGLSYNMFGEQNTFSNSSRYSSGASGDLNIGAIHRMTPVLAFGGIAGVTLADTQVTRDYVSRQSGNTYVYPRLALFGNMLF